MFVVISHHWCKPNMEDAARTRIDQSGVAMESAPGFLYRYRIEPPQDPTQILTMTAWSDEQAYRTFRASRSLPDPKDPSVPYGRVAMELYEVRRTHGKGLA
jgi:heme-degrading monooxygenase HmoA